MSTLKEIAKEVGVSIDTVSRVLNNKNKGAYASALRRADEIRKIAQKLKYRPNSSARSTRTGRFGCIALLLSAIDSNSFLPSQLLHGVHNGLTAHDLHFVISKLPDEKLTSSGFVPKILRELMADGLLLNYQAHTPQRMIELVKENAIPSIFLNTNQDTDCVRIDDLLGGRMATEHLIQQGHRNIAYVDYYNDLQDAEAHYSAIDRFRGYEQALSAHGLKSRLIGGRSIKQSDRLEYSRGWLKAEDRPTAVVAYSDNVAIPVLHAAELSGLRVPQDLSIVMFGESMAQPGTKLITSMILPFEALGTTAVDMLMEKVKNPLQPIVTVALPPVLTEAQTVCPRAV